MTRPADVGDPRDAAAPLRLADPDEDAARSRTTVGELIADAEAAGERLDYPSVPLDLDDVIARIGPERWAELRARFVAILAELRRRRRDADLEGERGDDGRQ